ncbi:class I tRNA ligase family protein [Massilia sp. B-10]|nr:class I tRNA ligase family protein [Massilia sp. B-10]
MFNHSYMHCWRHKTPIVYRATSQWFASMDNTPKDGGPSLRQTALKGIEETKFFPDWGQARLHGMIENRPDWTLSRQRQWGRADGLLPAQGNRRPAPAHAGAAGTSGQAVRRKGIDAWLSIEPKDLLGADADMYVKNKDTLDVWFDSGCTHQTVLRGSHAAQSQFPADLYLEGSDQHRGWFHSSLLTSSMLNGCPPYKALLTHGFAVDGDGKKMSKSQGNVVPPEDIFNKLGADILRLWVASTDYTGELSISDVILTRVTESYRRIRNTLRFLLANTSDFDHAKHALPIADLLEIDRYAIADMAALQRHRSSHYERYEFHPVVARLQNYCSEDLGGFYLDILKDRLYTSAVDSSARRSAQTALWHITHSLLRVMAPMLSFTAEEAWAVFASPEAYAASDETIFTQTFWTMPDVPDGAALVEKYTALREVRATVMKELEELRVSGAIGSSLQAELAIKASKRQVPAAGQPGGRPQVRVHHLASDCRRSGERGRRSDRGHRIERTEMRALLALPRRRRHPRRARGPVRPLPQQSVRQRRTARLRLIGNQQTYGHQKETSVLERQIVQRQHAALAGHRRDRDPARPDHQDHHPAHLRLEGNPVRDLVLRPGAGV